ncbi:hypothetical protein ACFL6S_11915 [Candidatus Poribacteria bacterium]
MDGNVSSSISLRIHGDNIVECERTIMLIAEAFSAQAHRVPSPLYLPQYEIRNCSETLFQVKLFPGHKQWGVNIQELLQSYGAPLREAADAIVTRVSPNGRSEEIILSIEYCNALPAGNQAWQRNGRGLACATVGIPYLYFVDVGGVELDANRNIKAPRFPNPIVPFSYLAASQSYDILCLPVYFPSPSSSECIRNRFEATFGGEEGWEIVRNILTDTSTSAASEALTQKDLELVKILSNERRSVDTLRDSQWDNLLVCETSDDKAQWLEQNRMTWAKKRAGKVSVTETLEDLVDVFEDSFSIGANSIPISMLSPDDRSLVGTRLRTLYGSSIDDGFLRWISESDSSLVVVWITGFKPRGDDSRPDRGLVPLARMLFGEEIDILSIVYGPAKRETWSVFRRSPQELARTNGLWEAIVNLSDAILVDSYTAINNPLTAIIQRESTEFRDTINFPIASSETSLSEHDVDSVLHALFAHSEEQGVFESMCNPPGGDWSGLSILDFDADNEFRWTSLPRVSHSGAKRPDHVIQFMKDDGEYSLLSIESKEKASDLNAGIGTRLSEYTQQLTESPPISARIRNAEWNLHTSPNIPLQINDFISGGAFLWSGRLGESGLERILNRGELDIVFAIEISSAGKSKLHIKSRSSVSTILPKIHSLATEFIGWLEIEVH